MPEARNGVRADDDLVSKLRWGASRSRFGWNSAGASREKTAELEGVRNADLGVGEEKLGTPPHKVLSYDPGKGLLGGTPQDAAVVLGRLGSLEGEIIIVPGRFSGEGQWNCRGSRCPHAAAGALESTGRVAGCLTTSALLPGSLSPLLNSLLAFADSPRRFPSPAAQTSDREEKSSWKPRSEQQQRPEKGRRGRCGHPRLLSPAAVLGEFLEESGGIFRFPFPE